MAKTLAFVFGAVLVLLGIAGFIANPLIGTGAFFEADTVHNLIHLVLGILLIVFAMRGQAVLSLKVVGIIALVLGVLGVMTVPSEGGMLLGIAMTNGASDWLHIVVGIVLIALGYFAKGSSAMAPQSMNSRGGGQSM